MSKQISIDSLVPNEDLYRQVYKRGQKGIWVVRHPTKRDQDIVIGKLLSKYDTDKDSFICREDDDTIFKRMQAWKDIPTAPMKELYSKAALAHKKYAKQIEKGNDSSSSSSSETGSASVSDSVIEYAFREDMVTVRTLAVNALKKFPQGAHYTEIARIIGKPESSVARELNPNNHDKCNKISLPWRDRDVVHVGPGLYIDRSYIHPRRIEQLAQSISLQPRSPSKEDIEKVLNESLWDASLIKIYDEPNFTFIVLDALEDQFILPRLELIKKDARLLKYFQSQNLDVDKVIHKYFEKYQEYRIALNTPYISRKKTSAAKKNGGVIPHFQGFNKEQQQKLMLSFYDAAESRGLTKLTLKTCPLIQKGFIRLFNKVSGDLQQLYSQLDTIKDFKTVLQESQAKTISSAKINLELWLLTYGGEMVTNYLAIRNIFQNNSKIRLVPTDDEIISALQSSSTLEDATAKLLQKA